MPSGRNLGDTGVPPSGSGHSAEPEPISVVSAVPASVPNARHIASDDLLIVKRLEGDCDQVTVGEMWFAAGTIRRLYEGLETAAKRFRDYEQIHRLKGTEEGDLKADNNADLAIYCEAALAKARGQ